MAEENGKTEANAGKVQPFDLRVTRRVRYWTDGAIIGSKAFVERIATDFFGSEQVRKKTDEGQQSSVCNLFVFNRLSPIDLGLRTDNLLKLIYEASDRNSLTENECQFF